MEKNLLLLNLILPNQIKFRPWIVQPTEHYEELSIKEIIERNKIGLALILALFKIYLCNYKADNTQNCNNPYSRRGTGKFASKYLYQSIRYKS